MGFYEPRYLIFWERIFPSQRAGIFLLASVFLGIAFHTKNYSTARSLISTSIVYTPPPPPPKTAMILPFVKIMKEVKEAKQTKTNIGVVYNVT